MNKLILVDNKHSKKERINIFFKDIKEWLYSKELLYLINLYGGNIDTNNTLEYNINYLYNFVKIWDFRARIGKMERWNIPSTVDSNIEVEKELIIDSLKKLGLINKTSTNCNPDYVLILGGASKSNYLRPMYSKEIIDRNNITNSNIVSISTLRVIDTVEKDSFYTDDIVYEYDALNKALELYYGVDSYDEEVDDNININLKSLFRKYNGGYKGNNIYSLAAPSSDINRRANSKDTFIYFLDKFNLKEGDTILLVTSQLYAKYQYFKFVDIALSNGYNIDYVGHEMDITNINKYLQEIKSMVDSIKELYDKYKDFID